MALLTSCCSGEKTVQQLNAEAPGMAVFSRCNVCKSEDIAAALRKAVEWFGRLDVLVNNVRAEHYR